MAPTAGNHYWNRRLRLELTKPPDWHFWSVVDFSAASALQQLVDGVPPEAQEILRSPDAAPFLVVAKLGPEDDGLTPCVCAYDEPRDDSCPPVVEALEEAVAGWGRFLADVVVAQATTPVNVPGAREAARTCWSFMYQHADGSCERLLVKTLLIFRGARMHTLQFMRPDGDSSDDDHALARCESSVRLGSGA